MRLVAAGDAIDDIIGNQTCGVIVISPFLWNLELQDSFWLSFWNVSFLFYIWIKSPVPSLRQNCFLGFGGTCGRHRRSKRVSAMTHRSDLCCYEEMDEDQTLRCQDKAWLWFALLGPGRPTCKKESCLTGCHVNSLMTQWHCFVMMHRWIFLSLPFPPSDLNVTKGKIPFRKHRVFPELVT